MMNCLFNQISTVFLITMIVSVSSRGYDCKPGERFVDICNNCICHADGENASCGRVACVPLNDPQFKCYPGERFRDLCKECICNRNGRSATCTNKQCEHD